MFGGKQLLIGLAIVVAAFVGGCALSVDVTTDGGVADAAQLCEPNPCVNGGTCAVIAGAPVCMCPEGLEGTTCEVVINACALNPCDENATCTPIDGDPPSAECACNDGFIEHPPASGVCVDDPCDPEACNGRGTCSADENATATCVCEEGYDAAMLCATCAAGFIDHPDGSGTCVDDPCDPDACNGRGACSADEDAAAVCVCEEGYDAATLCATCIAGFIDHPDGSGTCVDDPCDPDACNGRGACSADEDAAAVCVCEEGYDAATLCATCAAGFIDHPDGSGACVDDPCDPEACNGNGMCAPTPVATASCSCDMGYDPITFCATCVAGFIVHPNGSGVCVDDPCDPEACNDNGSCSATVDAEAECTCDFGFDPDTQCADCADGFMPDGSGGCMVATCFPSLGESVDFRLEPRFGSSDTFDDVTRGFRIQSLLGNLLIGEPTWGITAKGISPNNLLDPGEAISFRFFARDDSDSFLDEPSTASHVTILIPRGRVQIEIRDVEDNVLGDQEVVVGPSTTIPIELDDVFGELSIHQVTITVIATSTGVATLDFDHDCL